MWSLLGVLIASNLLVYQITLMSYSNSLQNENRESEAYPISPLQRHPFLDLHKPSDVAVALPSIRVADDKSIEETIKNVDDKRNFYGGKGDKPHLGGFANQDIDMQGVSPAAWKLMIQKHGIKSLLDVGCGRGISTSWFHMHGVKTQCVEGSHDAILQSVVPSSLVTEHDFSRGYVVVQCVHHDLLQFFTNHFILNVYTVPGGHQIQLMQYGPLNCWNMLDGIFTTISCLPSDKLHWSMQLIPLGEDGIMWKSMIQIGGLHGFNHLDLYTVKC
jgi:hypothetical protein